MASRRFQLLKVGQTSFEVITLEDMYQVWIPSLAIAVENALLDLRRRFAIRVRNSEKRCPLTDEHCREDLIV